MLAILIKYHSPYYFQKCVNIRKIQKYEKIIKIPATYSLKDKSLTDWTIYRIDRSN